MELKKVNSFEVNDIGISEDRTPEYEGGLKPGLEVPMPYVATTSYGAIEKVVGLVSFVTIVIFIYTFIKCIVNVFSYKFGKEENKMRRKRTIKICLIICLLLVVLFTAVNMFFEMLY